MTLQLYINSSFSCYGLNDYENINKTKILHLNKILIVNYH